MTIPFSLQTLYGVPLRDWREAARNALAALESNPADAEALEQLQSSHQVLREFAGASGSRESQDASPLGRQMRARNLADEERARDVSPVVSAGMGASQGLTFGLGDEAAGAFNAIGAGWRGENLGTAYHAGRDANRAFNAQAAAANPMAHTLGDLGGSLVSGGVGAAGAARALPAFGKALAGGAQLGATTGAKAASIGAGAALGGAEGALRGYGSGEEGPVTDVLAALRGAAVGAPLGAVSTALVNPIMRRSSLNSAREQTAANRIRETQAIADRSQEQAALSALRRQQAEELAPLRRRAAEQMDVLRQAQVDALPVRQTAAEQQAALRQARIESIPAAREAAANRGALVEQAVENLPLNQQLLEDRVAMSALRRAAMEADAAGASAGTSGREAFLRRALERQGMPEDVIQRAIAQDAAGGVPTLPARSVIEETARGPRPMTTDAPTPGAVPESEVPSLIRGVRPPRLTREEVLRDLVPPPASGGSPVQESLRAASGQSPAAARRAADPVRRAAREAYVTADPALGPEGAKEAARRAAAMRAEAEAANPPVTGGFNTESPLGRVLALPPDQMVAMLSQLAPEEARHVAAQVTLARSLGQLPDDLAAAALAALRRQ